MADLGDFDAAQVEPSRGFDLLPKGWVEAVIIESEAEDKVVDGFTKRRVTFVYQILDQRPEFKNRKLWHGLNLKNPSKEAETISRGQLSSICRAVGVQKPGDSTQLHNLPHMILIGQKVRKDTGEMQNVINDWKSKLAAVGGMAPAQPSLSQAPATAPAVAPGSKPAWAR